MQPASANPFATAGQRPVALRMRADLTTCLVSGGRRRYWRLRDPVALKHFELGDDEYFVLEQLDGAVSFDELRRRCELRCAPREVTTSQLVAFLNRLHQQGLVLATGGGQADELLRRRRAGGRERWLWGWARLLGMRWRGVDPEPMLRRAAPWVTWIFSPAALGAGVALMLAAVLLLAGHYEQLLWRMRDMQAFFSLRNAPWLVVTIVGVKILHELGHALACNRYGGQCHELGLMWLVFVPCLYCDVSDAWMFKSRWRRAMVGAAGIHVELVLAAVCTFLWWGSEPGWFNAACWNLMVVASVNTLLLNGNPLLRYDGYFILSDLWEIPNLHQRATGALRRGLAWAFLNGALPRDDLLAERSTFGLAAYAIASTAYRWFASLAVAWFCYQFLKPYHLELLAEGLAALLVAALLAGPARTVAAFTRNPSWTTNVHWPRVTLTAAATGAALAAFCFLPLPRRIYVPLLVEPAGARRVFVSAPGTLSQGARLGDRVDAGQALAQLANPELELEVARLSGERERLRIKVESLKQQQFQSAEAASMLPVARESLQDVAQRLARRLADRQRLALLAPQSGTVLSSRRRASRPERGDLAQWSGSPLDPENAGAYLATGVELCLVGDPTRWEAVLVVDEDQIAAVHVDQTVYVLLDHRPLAALAGKIVEVSQINLDEVAPELLAHRDLPSRGDSGGAARPARTCYQARVALGELEEPLIVGGTGEAKIVADMQPLGGRLLHWLGGTFRFQL